MTFDLANALKEIPVQTTETRYKCYYNPKILLNNLYNISSSYSNEMD